MNTNLVKFFSIQRQIFGVCSCCGEIFRLSDAHVYLKEKPPTDWLEKFSRSEKRLDNQEYKLDEDEAKMRDIARDKGRKQAARSAKKIDKIFLPNEYMAGDAKPLFHPIDFLIFNGMKNRKLENIVLFDREARRRNQKKLQNSIEKTVEKENYEWITMRVGEDGEIQHE